MLWNAWEEGVCFCDWYPRGGKGSLLLCVGTLFGVCMFLPQHVSRPCPFYLAIPVLVSSRWAFLPWGLWSEKDPAFTAFCDQHEEEGGDGGRSLDLLTVSFLSM